MHVYQNNISFMSENDMLSNAYKRSLLSYEERIAEHQRGLMAGFDAKLLGTEECKKIIMKETIAGHFDYIKGFNQAIGKDLAKKVYASIANSAK